jgi:hypothetical protein
MEPHEELMAANWAAWCFEANKSEFYCGQCGWPLDPMPSGFKPTAPLCLVCDFMDMLISTSRYFQKLDSEHRTTRRDSGLESV